MNIQLADRLVKLRKENKLSQEALAEKLGLSRQAISKWERAEASPDTDNLIALAELYGISLDELLGNEEAKQQSEPKSETTKEPKAETKGEKELKKAPLLLLGAVAIYVVGGIIIGDRWWAIMWTLFSLILAYALYFASTLAKKKIIRIMLKTLAVTMVAVTLYIFAGMLLSLWNIAWVVFLAIPAYLYLSFIKK